MKTKAILIRIILLTLSIVIVSLTIVSHSTVSASPQGSSRTDAATIDNDAIVYILSIGMGDNICHYQGLRNAFVIAGGKYILTAAHCVEDFDDTSRFRQQPMIISPYYGEVFEAKIIAFDEKNDIAILEPQWESHPSLALETDQNWTRTNTITIAGYPPPESLRGGSGKLSTKVMDETVTLQNTKGKAHSAIQVGPVKYPGRGWSGSPFINPKTGKVIGILSRERYYTKFVVFKKHFIYGPNVDSIQALIKDNHLDENTSKAALPDINQKKKFERIVSVLDSFRPDNKDQTIALTNEFADDYPESFFAHILAGWISDEHDDETCFQNAVQAAPKSSLVRAAYGQYLLAGSKHEQAAKHFKTALDMYPDNIVALHGQLTLLTITEPEQAEILGQKLTEKFPDNAGFWFEYSKALRAQNKYKEELPAIKKALLLTNDSPYLYWRHMADSLTANKSHKAAETAYNALFEKHECETCWLAYASLLIEMGPDKTDQIRTAIDKAKSFNKNQKRSKRKYKRYERSLQKLIAEQNKITDPNQ